MYKVGTYVSYRAEGICVISEIRSQKFGTLSEHKDFYILSPLRDPNSKLFVPTDNDALISKMHILCSADEVNDLAKELREKRLEWDIHARRRSNYFKDILSDGNRELLISLIHTVNDKENELSKQGKHVTQGDITALERAKKMLVSEFSFTTDISNEETLMAVINCEIECNDK